MWTVSNIGSMKVGSYMLIDEEPCKIVDINTSKPGKHGEAKARIEAIGLFDGKKRSVVHPVKHKVQVPMIDRRNAQIVAIMGDEVQLMDMETYETFNIPIPEDLKGQLQPGTDIVYIVAMEKKMLMKK
jgi:translation initiation factor 5A